MLRMCATRSAARGEMVASAKVFSFLRVGGVVLLGVYFAVFEVTDAFVYGAVDGRQPAEPVGFDTTITAHGMSGSANFARDYAAVPQAPAKISTLEDALRVTNSVMASTPFKSLFSTTVSQSSVASASPASQPIGGKALSVGDEALSIKKAVMSVEDVRKTLPHRYPFLFVDRVIELEKGVRGVGMKQVSMNEQFFLGHFPEKPIMPGVLQIEALAQMAGIVFSDGGKLFLFAGVDGVKWRRPVVPGDTLFLEVNVVSSKRGMFKCTGHGYVSGQLAIEVKEMTFAAV